MLRCFQKAGKPFSRKEVPVDLILDKYEPKAMSDEARLLMQELEFRNLHEIQTILGGGSDGAPDLLRISVRKTNIEIALLNEKQQNRAKNFWVRQAGCIYCCGKCYKNQNAFYQWRF